MSKREKERQPKRRRETAKKREVGEKTTLGMNNDKSSLQFRLNTYIYREVYLHFFLI